MSTGRTQPDDQVFAPYRVHWVVGDGARVGHWAYAESAEDHRPKSAPAVEGPHAGVSQQAGRGQRLIPDLQLDVGSDERGATATAAAGERRFSDHQVAEVLGDPGGGEAERDGAGE